MIFSLSVFHVIAALLNKERFFFRKKIHLYELLISSILISYFTSLTLFYKTEYDIRYFAAITRLIINAKNLL